MSALEVHASGVVNRAVRAGDRDKFEMRALVPRKTLGGRSSRRGGRAGRRWEGDVTGDRLLGRDARGQDKLGLAVLVQSVGLQSDCGEDVA